MWIRVVVINSMFELGRIGGLCRETGRARDVGIGFNVR